jgi:hypothetical protein
VLDDLPEAGGLELGVVEQALQRVHDHRGDVQAIELGEPLGVGAARGDVVQLPVEDLDVAQPRGERLEARIVEQVLAAGQREEVAPVLVRVGKDRQVAVLGLERPAIAVEDPLVARRIDRGHERLAVQVLDHHPRGEALEHRDLDLLALAGARLVIERCEDVGEQGHRAGLVGDDGRHVARLAHDRGLQRRQPGGGLDDVVVGRLVAVRSGRPEAVGADVDEPRVDRAKHLVGEPESPRRLRTVVVDEHVRLLGEPHQDLPRRFLLEVEHDGPLVAVHRQVERAHVGVAHRAELPGRIPLGRLDLDDVRPEVPELLPRPGPQHDRRAVHDPNSGKRSRHARHSSPGSRARAAGRGGVRGVRFSPPEPVFQNVRKGSFEYVPR